MRFRSPHDALRRILRPAKAVRLVTTCLVLSLAGCTARKTMIDMRTMPVWNPTDTATSCIVEVAGHNAAPASFPVDDESDDNYWRKTDLQREFSTRYQPDHQPSRFFDFHERILVKLQFDPCRRSPELNGLWLGLQELQPDNSRWAPKATIRDSILLVINSTQIPYDQLTWAKTSLRILQVGQEELPSWSRRLGQKLKETKESGKWKGETGSKNLWLLNHAWLPNRPRTLIMQSTTQWESKTIVDTFTIDMDAKSLVEGFWP